MRHIRTPCSARQVKRDCKARVAISVPKLSGSFLINFMHRWQSGPMQRIANP